jgi:ethanolamine-phosphate phospho-lyase
MSVERTALSYDQTVDLRKRYIGKSCTLFYRDNPLKIVRASMQYMYDEKDNQYLDCVNNVAHVGHCHPDVVAAECAQAATLNTNSRFLNDNIVLCAEKICSLLPDPLDVCFFVNSGSEANDLALQLAHYHTKADDVITVDHAYHGHLTSIVAISPYKYTQRKGYKKPDWVHVAPCPDVYRGKYRKQSKEDDSDFGFLYANEVRKIIEEIESRDKRLSAFIVESLQSCAGQIILPENYLRSVYKYVRDAGGVCIADEVQVGFGRMGSKWWAFQLQGDDVVPDIVTLGKPMGNGHPVSAVVTTREVAASFYNAGGSWFNTFGGNPVSCAVALAVIRVLERENLLERARQVGERLLTRLQRELFPNYSIIGDIRGQGLFVGIELVEDRASKTPATEKAQIILDRLKNEFRVIVTTDGPHENILKLKPPMVFTEANADFFVSSLEKILSTL